MDNSIIILAAQQLLGVKRPVEIRMHTRKPSKHKDFAAWYTARYRKENIVRHVIFVNIRVVIACNFNLTEVILHEIVHAAQFEYGVFDEKKHHDKKFQKMCKYLEKEFLKMGVNIVNLYSPHSDTT